MPARQRIRVPDAMKDRWSGSNLLAVLELAWGDSGQVEGRNCFNEAESHEQRCEDPHNHRFCERSDLSMKIDER